MWVRPFSLFRNPTDSVFFGYECVTGSAARGVGEELGRLAPLDVGIGLFGQDGDGAGGRFYDERLDFQRLDDERRL